jgi:acyl-CoA reductase-like NAD-dependent aldehyde dehydrogenase
VLLDPPESAQISRKEVFGPVVCVYPYNDIDEAITRANQLPYSFQAAVFTANIDTAMKVYKGVDGSAIMVNDHTAFRVDWMPFAGLKESGLGTGGIPHTIRDMQVEKMLVLHSAEL